MGEDVHLRNGHFAAWKRSILLIVIERNLRCVEDWLNFASVYLIMFLFFFTTAEVLGRYLFNNPIPGHVEIVELIMAGVVFLGLAHTERIGGHVRMELFITRVFRGRIYHFAEIITTTLSLVAYILIFVYTFKSALFCYEVGDCTGYLYWPTWPSKFAVPVGCLFLCLRFIIEILQHLYQAIIGVEMRDLN